MSEARAGGKRRISSPRWRRMTGEDRRRQIVAVAQQLFARNAYDEVSTSEIAAAAGVTHGLLTYHFGSKRNLYLEVVRATLWIPRSPVRLGHLEPDLDRALGTMVDWWLTELERNREMWLSVLGARGVVRDPDINALLDAYEEQSRDDIVAFLTARAPEAAPAEVFAIVAAWQGLAEATAVEWLRRGRINRQQAKLLILEGLRRLLRVQRLLAEAGRQPDAATAAA